MPRPRQDASSSPAPPTAATLVGLLADEARLRCVAALVLGATTLVTPDGTLASIPAARAKRLVVLDLLAGRFEPGRVYPERDVNTLLARVHPDHAALRRHVVDEGFLERREGFYRRAGGTFEVD